MASYPSLSLLFLLVASACTATTAVANTGGGKDLVHSMCVHASYPNICLRTLSAYPGPAQTPLDLAQAAVSVSFHRARKVSNYLSQVARTSEKGVKGALSDCLDQMGDSAAELSDTMKELKHLQTGSFRWRMSNAETWVSAALTDQDTCLDGMGEVGGGGFKNDVKRKIKNVAKVTSNALYLINRLDHSHGVP